jgi:hypothetical protein
MRLRSRLQALEKLGGRNPTREEPEVLIYIPDNGTEGMPPGRYGNVIIYTPETAQAGREGGEE